MGRITKKRAEVELTEEERIKLADARAVVAELSEREPLHEALTEVGYEQRQCRAEALRLAVQTFAGTRPFTTYVVVETAAAYANFIWNGNNTISETEVTDCTGGAAN